MAIFFVEDVKRGKLKRLKMTQSPKGRKEILYEGLRQLIVVEIEYILYNFLVDDH